MVFFLKMRIPVFLKLRILGFLKMRISIFLKMRSLVFLKMRSSLSLRMIILGFLQLGSPALLKFRHAGVFKLRISGVLTSRASRVSQNEASTLASRGRPNCDCPAQWGLPRGLATMPQGTDQTLWYGPGAPRESQATLTDGPATGNLSSCYPPGGMAIGSFGIRRLLVAQHTAFLAPANLQMARHTQFWHLAASWWASECQFGILASLQRRGR